ncbi:MAG: hypothetical protein ACI9UN_003351 [Granulosicoccus sp.]|jgi:hypothetical protein
MNSSTDLIIGFSFSLMPDGAAGSYNTGLAEQLAVVLESRKATLEDIPVVALQWEIADALSELYPKLTEQLTKLERLIIVKPPKFLKEGVDLDLFEKWLKVPSANYKNVLEHCLELAAGETILEKLNSLLDDAAFYEKFEGLQLANLVRPKLGDLFTEARILPHSKYYPNGLREHQRIRINRLIVEAIVEDEKIVQRGQYLSTRGVLESVLDSCHAKDYAFGSVKVIAHSLHRPRCMEQLAQILRAKNLSVLMQEEVMSNFLPWDTSGAQVWCRSRDNWEAYEEVVSGNLKNSR